MQLPRLSPLDIRRSVLYSRHYRQRLSSPFPGVRDVIIIELSRLTIPALLGRSPPVFSALQWMIEQPEPFEMTPTRKLKRYLYVKNE